MDKDINEEEAISRAIKKYGLKPCPWCGQKPEVYCFDFVLEFHVSCENKKCSYGPYSYKTFKTVGGAVRAWNRRKK